MQLALSLATPRARPSKVRSYFDTTRLPLPELVAAISRAELQDDAVLAAFRCHLVLSPSRCHSIVTCSRPMLITSVRRSISTLTAAGVLVKLTTQVPGPYGTSEHLWELVAPQMGVAA